MSVAVCRGPAVPAFEAPCWLKPAAEPYKPEPVVERRLPAREDIWNAIQAGAAKKASSINSKSYLVSRSSSSSRLMSQKSLEVCTESLGNETGSGDFTDMASLFFDTSPLPAEEPFWAACDREEDEDEQCDNVSEEEVTAVNYHRSSRSPPRRSFPPPLPSMSRRDGPCLRMRPRREDGRLVVEAVAVRPRGYLHGRRQDGRLCLSFVECCSARREQSLEQSRITPEAPFFPAVEPTNIEQEEDATMEMDEEEEEEVEVVDRGMVVEVKVSTQPQTPAAGKAHHRCSRLVINKFVGSTPLSTLDQPQPRCQNEDAAYAAVVDEAPAPPKLRRVPSSTTTLAAAVAEASTGTDDEEDDDDECGGLPLSEAPAEPKQLLLFTSRRGDKQDLLQSVRRCRQLRQKPLFILEPYCIATT